VERAKGHKAIETAVLLTKPNGRQERYAMFEVHSIEDGEALLRGPLLLEVGEPLMVEVVFDDGSKVRAKVTVEGTELGPEPGIRVSFKRDSDRKAISAKLG